MRRLLFVLLLTLVSGPLSATILVTGTGTLSCSTWLKAREARNEAQTELMVQWIAGFAVSFNYYGAADDKQLDVKLGDIRYFADKYCRDNPLVPSLMLVAAEYVQRIGGPTAYHNRKK